MAPDFATPKIFNLMQEPRLEKLENIDSVQLFAEQLIFKLHEGETSLKQAIILTYLRFIGSCFTEMIEIKDES